MVNKTPLALLWVAIIFLSPPSLKAEAHGFHKVMQYGRGVPQSIFWSPDGSTVLVNSLTGAWFYDGSTLETQHHLAELQSAVYSPNGHWLLGSKDDGELALYDANTYEPIELPHNLTNGKFSPNSQWLLATNQNRQPVLLDTDRFIPASLPGELQQAGMLLMWSPNGETLATLNAAKELIVWQVGAPELLFKVDAEVSGYVSWSPEGSKLLWYDEENHIRIWDAQSGALLTEIPPQPKQPHNEFEQLLGMISWKPDGSQIIRYYSSNDAVWIEIYDTASGTIIHELNAYQLFWTWYSPNSQYLVLSDGLYDAANYQKISDFYLQAAHWNPDSTQIALVPWFGSQVHIFDVIERTITQIIEPIPNDSGIGSIFWSPNSQKILSSDQNGRITLWDTRDGQQIAKLDEHTDLIDLAVFNQDGTRLAVADTVGKIRLWNLENNTLIATLNAHSYKAGTILWQPNGKLFVTQTAYRMVQTRPETNLIRVWDGSDGHLVQTLLNSTGIEVITWSPDGEQLFYTSRSDDVVHIWNPDDHSIRSIDTWNRGYGYAPYPRISWSPDDQLLVLDYNSATHGGQSIQIQDAISNTVLAPQIAYSWPTHYIWLDNSSLAFVSKRCSGWNERSATAENCTITFTTRFNRSDAPYETDLWPDESSYDFMLGPYATDPEMNWSPNNRWFALKHDQQLEIWRFETASLEREITLNGASGVDWSPNSQFLVVRYGSYDEGFTAAIMDFTNREIVFNLDNAQHIRWSPDSSMIEGYGNRIWEVATGQIITEYEGMLRAWSPDGNAFVTWNRGIVSLWSR